MELISVIVPIYNVEKYLIKCIDSIISQTYKNLEIILIDDGSPDDCGQICDDYAQKDSRIVVIHKENGGLSDARNAGLDIMRGEYVVFVDSDDWVSKYHIENLYHLVKKYNVDMAITSFRQVYENQDIAIEEKKISDEAILIHSPTKCIENMFYGRPYDVGAWAKIYKKELFGQIRFPINIISEDIAILPLAISKINRVAFCDKKEYFYFMRTGSITRKFYRKNMEVFKLLDKLICEFGDNKNILNAIYFKKTLYSLGYISRFYNYLGKEDYLFLKKTIKENFINYLFNMKIHYIHKIKIIVFCLFGGKFYNKSISMYLKLKNKY